MGENLLGAILHGVLMIRSCQGQGSFSKYFSEIIFHFSNDEGIHKSIEDKALTKIMEVLILEVNCEEISKAVSCSA